MRETEREKKKRKETGKRTVIASRERERVARVGCIGSYSEFFFCTYSVLCRGLSHFRHDAIGFVGSVSLVLLLLLLLCAYMAQMTMNVRTEELKTNEIIKKNKM